MAITLELDHFDLDEFVQIAACSGQESLSYVVTPNVDQLIRLHDDAAFRTIYSEAAYRLLDSRFLSHLFLLTMKARAKVCTGSDLTARLFSSVIDRDDRVLLIGGTKRQVAELSQAYALSGVRHYNPPMGFIYDVDAVEECLAFIEKHSPFRFCLLALGCPQQEILAYRLKQRARARGLVLCVGASVNFLTGAERRAPRWMRHSGLEWLYRLLQSPVRLGRRYLIRGPRVFTLLPRTKVTLRRDFPVRICRENAGRFTAQR